MRRRSARGCGGCGPGEASTRHRHYQTHELYVVLDGEGRMRSATDLLTLPRLSAVLVEPDEVRQVFNDTDADVLWLVVGAPPEPANTLEMSEETLAHMYPDGPKALPPELQAMTDRLHFTGNEDADRLIARTRSRC